MIYSIVAIVCIAAIYILVKLNIEGVLDRIPGWIPPLCILLLVCLFTFCVYKRSVLCKDNPQGIHTHYQNAIPAKERSCCCKTCCTQDKSHNCHAVKDCKREH